MRATEPIERQRLIVGGSAGPTAAVNAVHGCSGGRIRKLGRRGLCQRGREARRLAARRGGSAAGGAVVAERRQLDDRDVAERAQAAREDADVARRRVQAGNRLSAGLGVRHLAQHGPVDAVVRSLNVVARAERGLPGDAQRRDELALTEVEPQPLRRALRRLTRPARVAAKVDRGSGAEMTRVLLARSRGGCDGERLLGARRERCALRPHRFVRRVGRRGARRNECQHASKRNNGLSLNAFHDALLLWRGRAPGPPRHASHASRRE